MGVGVVLVGCVNVGVLEFIKINFDVIIFNFVLNFEYFEVVFYFVVVGCFNELIVVGGDVSKVILFSGVMGMGGIVVLGLIGDFWVMMEEIVDDEFVYVKVICSVLGSVVVV